jgi:hypothetical protein
MKLHYKVKFTIIDAQLLFVHPEEHTTYIYIYVCIHTHTHTSYIYAYTCMHVCAHTQYIYTHMCILISERLYTANES